MYDTLIREIKNLNDVLIISDDDLDGICSAKLMSIILSKLNIKHEILFRKRNNSNKNLFEKIEKDEIIMLDLALKEDLLKKLSENKKIIYIDHHYRHIPENLPNSVVFFDYKALYGEDICTTCIVYRIGREMFKDFSKYSLLAFIGMLGDVSYDKIIMDDFKKRYKNLLQNNIPIISLNYLFTILSSLEPEEVIDLDFDKDMLNLLLEIKNKKIYKKIRSFFEKIFEFKIFYENEKLIIIETKKPSVLSTFISPFYDDKIIVAITPTKSLIFKKRTVKVSLRTTREDIDLGLIAKEFTENHGISGGGHKKAAGAIIKTEDIKKFIEFIKKKL